MGGLALMLGGVTGLHAEGSPPLITDDPGTPGNHHWEINLGFSTAKREGARLSELPLIDLNYGLGDRWQLKFEVPYLQLKEDGAPTESAFGNSEIGVKYRFLDAGEKGPAMSVYPQLEFVTPGSPAEEHGLVESGTVFKLPFQYEQEFGPVDIVAQAGYEFRPHEGTWQYGISAGHSFNERWEIAVELAGESDSRFGRSLLVTNLGVVINLSEKTSCMFSVGRELHNHEESKATFLGYIGMQWRL